MFKMKHSEKRQILVTPHAKCRLAERAPHINPKDYTKFAQSARYKGLNVTDIRLDDKIRKYILSHYRKNNSESLIAYRGYIFIFCGNSRHNRTLKTVVELPERLMKEGKLIENVCNR